MRKWCSLPAICFLLLTNLNAVADDSLPQVVEFNRDIRPILSSKCFHCHGPDDKQRQAELRFDLEDSAKLNREGSFAIKPGEKSASEVWNRITTDDPDLIMPPHESKKELTKREIDLLGKWIEQGAKWQGHWSFLSPTEPPLPTVKNQQWPRNAIDNFTLSRLEQNGRTPSPRASKETLIRRVTFDLTGLPPTLAEIDAFLNDNSPNAFEKVVDRLLASEHYGERMALMWMDAARYGDSSVFHADGPRDMWPWRDWAIRAYNNNLPFDKFTTWQLAGDLIPNATIDQKIASGFHRNHGTTDEGGAIAEEYRVEYIVDRVKTTGTVWLGLTLECAQCHSHKYDPITQKEYYQIFAFFNNNVDGGMQTRNGNAAPLVEVPNLEGETEAKKLETRIQELQTELANYETKIEQPFKNWLAKLDGQEKKVVELPGNAIAYYSLNQVKGNKLINEVDPKQKTSFKGGKPEFVAGKYGQALKFNGGLFADLGNVGDFERTEGFSYGGWINMDKSRSGAPIARMDDGNNFRGYDLYMQGGRFAAHIISQWPTNAVKVVTKKTFPADVWHHVFVCYDGSSKAAGVKIYVNGKEEPWAIEQNKLTGTIHTDKPLYLGRRNPGSPFKGMLDDIRLYRRTLTSTEVSALAGADPLGPILATAPEKRTPEQISILRHHYLTTQDKTYTQLQQQITDLRSKVTELTKPLSTVMVMADNPKMRPTYLLERGHYASPKKDEVIQPNTLNFLPPMQKDLPKNRLGLAKWIVSPDHPLTSRVTVNRYWYMLFGTGLVKTVEDFGSQGEWPSHPALLDWLATDFVKHGWDIKRTLKQIVMSATYQQSSKITPELLAADPDNRLFTRGPRFRLQGEFLRDQALAISGLLVPTIGGKGVKPYQPPGLWNEVSLSGNVRFVQDKGEDLYRRSMYTYWKRSAPAPSMMIFDVPTREKCVVQRPRTNTPLQALVTLNDPQFVEASRALGQRMLTEGGKSTAERISFAYRLATGHLPASETLNLLQMTFDEELAIFQKNPEQATKLLSVGDSPRDEKLNAAEHAAWTVIASIILNLDQTLTRW